jgi:hypothetical protein
MSCNHNDGTAKRELYRTHAREFVADNDDGDDDDDDASTSSTSDKVKTTDEL